MLTLRPYQSVAVQSTLAALRGGYHPVIALPTGSGKSLVLAALCQALPGRILIAAHVKELLQQNSEEVMRFDPAQDVGVYSAGLESRARTNRIIVGGVQSIYQRMDAMQQAGAFQYVLIDEAHRCGPRDTEAKMYNAVFASCPQAQRVGLSATPYRLDNGAIYGKPESWFDVLAHETAIRDLTPEYLAPLRGVLTAHDMPLDGVRTRQGDFVTGDLSQVACDETLVDATVQEMCWLARKRQRWLIFCVDVAHTQLVAKQLRAQDICTGVITGKTSAEERDATLKAFRAGELRALANCQVLTTGYNCPSIDCIAVIRPTQSKALFVQMIGRGSRQAEEKRDCSILDYGGNIERFVPLDDVWDIHKSPERVEQEAKKEAQKQRQRHQAAHDTEASLLDPMAEHAPALTLPVLGVTYDVSVSQNAAHAGKAMLTALYRLAHPVHKWVKQWVCLEHVGGARFHAQRWFDRRGAAMPPSAHEALASAKRGDYEIPESVVVHQDGKYLRVKIEHFSEKES